MIHILTLHPASLLILSAILSFYASRHNKLATIIISIIGPISSMLWFLEGDSYSVANAFGYEIIPIFYSAYSKMFGLGLYVVLIGTNLYAISNKHYKELALGQLYYGAGIIVLLAGDFITMFIGIELMLFFSTFIIFVGDNAISKSSAMRFFIMHMISGTLFLFGIILLTNNAPDRAIYELAEHLILDFSEKKYIGSCLIFLAVLINIGCPPFSAWISDSYPVATTSGSVYLIANTTKVNLYVLMLLFPGVKGLIFFGVIMFVYGIIYAVIENNIRRMLSFLGISQIGLMMIGCSQADVKLLTMVSFLAFCHMIYKSLLMICAGILKDIYGYERCDEIGEIDSRILPALTCSCIAILYLIAFPYTGTFLVKHEISNLMSEHKVLYYLFYAASLLTLLAFPIKKFFIISEKQDYVPNNKLQEISLYYLAGMLLLVSLFGKKLFAFLLSSRIEISFSLSDIITQLSLILLSVLFALILLDKDYKRPGITLNFDFIYRKLLYPTFLSNVTLNFEKDINIVSEVFFRVFDRFGNFHQRNITLQNALILLKLILLTAIGIIILVMFNLIGSTAMAATMPPIAAKKDYSYSIHGQTINDPYSWLRDANWPKVEDKEIISYLEQENNYTKSYFKKLEPLKETLYKEIIGRIKLADESVPVKDEDYYYFTRTFEDKNYPAFLRKKGKDGKEELMIDQNKLAEGKEFFSLGSMSVSNNQKLLAYSYDDDGSERFTVVIKDLETGKLQKDAIKGTLGSIVWLPDDSGFFYTPVKDNWRTHDVYLHKLGSKEDKLIFSEKREEFRVSIGRSSSKQYLIIDTGDCGGNENYVIDLANASLETVKFNNRKEDVHISIDHGEDGYFYIHTNEDSKNFKLVRCSDKKLGQENWQEFIKPEERYLNSFDISKNYLVLNYKRAGLAEIEVRELAKNGKTNKLQFSEPTYVANASVVNYKEDEIRVSYSSLIQPNAQYLYHFATNKLELLKQTEIPSGYNKEEYACERVWANNNGTMVPISLFYRKDKFKKDGSNPLYLYAYGSYGSGVSPSFRTSVISLVDRGFVYAIAHIRGGDDLGFDWYEAAKFLTKKRTFEDFIACAQHLADGKYTSVGNITIMGGSAGGMLMGAVANARPDLFKSVIAHVPFVDVINTMLDESLPLTLGEFKEWGNPKDKEYFEYMKSYSPYENVKRQNYPAVFVTGGLTDPRVGYWEPAKWVAKLRQYKTDNNILLLKTNMGFGHSGASGRFDAYKELAEEFAFILHENGISK